MTAVVAACLVLAGCASNPKELPPIRVGPATGSVSPSPTVSIYPVPPPTPPKLPRTSAAPIYVPTSPLPSSAASSPATSPSPSISADSAGIRCGEVKSGTEQGVKVQTTYTCYQITGSTLPQLQASAAKNGPKVGGKHAVATTKWSIKDSYTYGSKGSLCTIATAAVQALIVYVFPTWTAKHGTPASVVKQWRSYMAKVKAHEAHHRSIAIDGGAAVYKAILATPPDSPCKAVGNAADAKVADVMAVYRAKQAAFDAAAGA